MNPLQPLPMFFFRSSHGLSDDVEMLQTDVMRFFAILCLCLMAIFALVKTLPMAPPDVSPTISEPANLRAEAHLLQEQIATLKEKLVAMQIQANAAAAAAQKSSDQAVKAEETKQAVLAKVVKAQQELEVVSQSLSKTERDIEVREMKLANLVKHIVNKRQIRAELKTEILKETQNLTKIKAALDRVQEKLDHRFQQTQAPRNKSPEATPPPKPTKKGFSLQFASDAALETLIIGRQVDFYAIAAEKAWQLKLGGERPVFVSDQIPRQIYEMETHTVPTAYTAIFYRQVAAFGQGTVIWGVTLPAQTIASINHLIKGREGGDLVISANGAVSLN